MTNVFRTGVAVLFVLFIAAAAFGELPLLQPPRPALPQAGGPAVAPVAGPLVRQVIENRTLPQVTRQQGAYQAMQQVRHSPLQQARTVGYLAEEDFVRRNPAWKLVANPYATQNDVFLFDNKQLQGGQIKTHASGNPKLYVADMRKDWQAEYFIVPDDHEPAVRQELERRIAAARRTGDVGEVARWQQQQARLQPLGRTYGDLEQAVLKKTGQAIRHTQAIRGAIGGGIVVLAVEGGVVVYRNVSGELTPQQSVLAAGEGAVKAGAVATATGAAILAGANPVGITVIVVGGVIYFVVDYAVTAACPLYWTDPLNAAEIEQLLPPGWMLDDPLRSTPSASRSW